MSRLTPCKRRDLIRKLRALGFEGPFVGTRHHLMVIGDRRLAIPSYDEISVPKTREVIHEASGLLGRQIDIDEWLAL